MSEVIDKGEGGGPKALINLRAVSLKPLFSTCVMSVLLWDEFGLL